MGPKMIWYGKNSYTMCFPNSAYIQIHTNIINAFPFIDNELMTVDNIANFSGHNNDLGVTITEGKLQRLGKKINDSLQKGGHTMIDFSFVLETNIDRKEIERRLMTGEIVLAAFSSKIYNTYFQKEGRTRPCVATLDRSGIDTSPPHYVSLMCIDDSRLGILDPLCKYIAKKQPIDTEGFLKDNVRSIEVMDRSTFYDQILFNKQMDGIDLDNRELIYTNIITSSDPSPKPSKILSEKIAPRCILPLEQFEESSADNHVDEKDGGKNA